MRSLLRWPVILLGFLPAYTATTARAAEVRDSVVKIEVTSRSPDYFRPWTKRSPSRSSGSGVMISGGRLLTNAHVVQYASQIEVQPSGSSTKHEARVVVVAPEMDLALLEFDDPAIAAALPPLEIDAALPELRQDVTVLGYPVGGDELSITEGIVSRIEYAEYYYYSRGLRIQIDAALNPGNSGGPAVSDGRLIGLVFSTIEEADNIGYLIPSEEIETFLADVEDGRYDGKPSIRGDVYLQRLENPTLRERLSLDRSVTGIMARTTKGAPEGGLRPWDVVTHVGPLPVDNQGFARVSDSLRLAFGYFVPRFATDAGVPLTVFREGESIGLTVPTERDSHRVLTLLGHDYPEYFVWGPVVFSGASQELVWSGRRMNQLLISTQSPLLGRLRDRQAFDQEQIVIIPNRLLPHRTSRGYGTVAMSVVETVNGTAVRNLPHLVELLRDASSKYIEIDLGGTYETLVFDRDETEAATEEILSDEGIRRRGSPALLEVWRGESSELGGS